MKSTRSGNKWAHVNCALWIPEISIADPERMEPITKVKPDWLEWFKRYACVDGCAGGHEFSRLD